VGLRLLGGHEKHLRREMTLCEKELSRDPGVKTDDLIGIGRN